jgi:4-amino-4-deoxy-L-arabinose transferase-like glycosyltransferase
LSAERERKRWAWAPVIILLLAFAARAFWLDRQFLWWDEGLSVYFANQRLPALLTEMRATHYTDPPVYNLALAGWRVLAGNSPYAVRFFSVLAGVTMVACTWIVGRWLADRNTALLATLSVALAPPLVHYAREAKGYTFAAAFALLSVYAWGRRLGYSGDRPPPGNRFLWWIVYVLSTVAAVGTHYYLGLLVVWQGLWVAGGTVLAFRSPARRAALKRMGQWGLAAAAIALPLAPGALTTFDATLHGVAGVSVAEPLSLFDYLGRVFGAFGAGPGAQGAIALIGGCAVVLLTGIGTFANSQQAFLLSWFAVPLLAAYLVQSAYSFFYPRFLLYLGPPLYLLTSLGVATLGRRSRAITTIAALTIVGLWLPGLARAYAGPSLPPVVETEDPRPLAAHLRAEARPGDALAYGYIWQVGYLLSYDPQSQMALYRAHYTAQNVGTELESIFASHPRLWLLSYRVAAEDPANLPGSWLEGAAYKVESGWYGPHHLALYLAADFQTPGVGPDEATAVFDEQIELRYPRVDARLKPGDVLALPLRWRAMTAPGEDYHAFVHLGVAGAPPLVQNDGPPRNGTSPTGAWAAGQEVLDRRALALPDTLPPGRYRVFVGLYRPSDGSRLPVDGQGTDILPIGNVQVEP